MILDLSNPSVLLLTCLAVLVSHAWTVWVTTDDDCEFWAFIGPVMIALACCVGIGWSLFTLIKLGLSHHSP